MGRRQRLESKLQKRIDWAASRERQASEHFQKSEQAVAGIVFGQPILVGHHSEKRHRSAIAKCEHHGFAGVDDLKMAEHHREKAAGLESTLDAIFSDDEDAVEKLEAKIAELSAERERWKAYNKSCRSGSPNLDLLDEHQKEDIVSISRVASYSIGKLGQAPSYKLQNLGANIRRYEQRLEAAKARQTRAVKAEQAGGVSISSGNGWCVVTFAEKPSREILNDLKANGYRWRNGSWQGSFEKLPESVKASAESEVSAS